MSEDRPLFFSNAGRFRGWLEENHRKLDEAWIGFYRKESGKPSIDWPQAVDEALCFGWIDGLRKKHDELSYKIRFTPRRPTSTWSRRNIERYETLLAEDRIRPEGEAAWQRRRDDRSGTYSFEQNEVAFDAEQEKRFRANGKAWRNFQSEPPGYRRTATWWVVSAKREETRSRRLEQLISDSEKGVRIRQFRR